MLRFLNYSRFLLITLASPIERTHKKVEWNG
jgi:hypothetical protein